MFVGRKKVKGLINFLKGIAVGIATLVPGVSGGTMSIILGIYDDLIHSVSSFFHDWKKNLIFLGQVALGGLLGMVLLSNVLEEALIKYPFVMKFFFIGVIFGGLPVLFKKASGTKSEGKGYIFFAIGFIIVFLMSSEPGSVTTLATTKGILSVIFLLIAGFIIAIALILPGISGSFMLLALGLYDVTLNAINTLNIPFLIPLALGALIGTVATTKTIEKLLQKYPRKTYMLILGFIAGSIPQVYPGIPTGGQFFPSIVAIVLGFILIYILGKKESNQ